MSFAAGKTISNSANHAFNTSLTEAPWWQSGMTWAAE